jgi:hypothetical protein
VIKIEIVEECGIKSGVNHHLKGEVLVSANDDQEFEYRSWKNAGLAKDLSTGEIGERKAGAVKIDVDSIRQEMSSDT